MEDMNINELEEMLSPKAEFKASPSLKDKVIAEARDIAMRESESMKSDDDRDTKDIPHIVLLKPKIRRSIYIIGAIAAAACVLVGFIIFGGDGRKTEIQRPAIAKVTKPKMEKVSEKRGTDTVFVQQEEDVTAEPVHEQPLLARETTETEDVGLAYEETDDGIEYYYIPVSGREIKTKPKPVVNTQMMDDCIARMSKQYKVEPLVFDCQDSQQTGRTEIAYDFPDEKGNMIMAQMAKVASKYVEQNEDLNYIYSRNQFIMQLQNGEPNSPIIDTWQAERTNGRIIIYRTHSVGDNIALSGCFLEYKDRNVNMRGDIM